MSTQHGHHHQQVVTDYDKADQWHTHTVTEGAPQDEHAPDIAYGRVFWLGVIGFLIIVAATYATWEYYKVYMTEIRNQREELQATIQDGSLLERQQILAVDQNAPVGYIAAGNYIHVPVETAAERVMKRYAR